MRPAAFSLSSSPPHRRVQVAHTGAAQRISNWSGLIALVCCATFEIVVTRLLPMLAGNSASTSHPRQGVELLLLLRQRDRDLSRLAVPNEKLFRFRHGEVLIQEFDVGGSGIGRALLRRRAEGIEPPRRFLGRVVPLATDSPFPLRSISRRRSGSSGRVRTARPEWPARSASAWWPVGLVEVWPGQERRSRRPARRLWVRD